MACVNGAVRRIDFKMATPARCFITDDGYLISNDHVVKAAAKVRLLTGEGLIDASLVKVDAANDLALLKAVGGLHRCLFDCGFVALRLGVKNFPPRFKRRGCRGGRRAWRGW